MLFGGRFLLPSLFGEVGNLVLLQIIRKIYFGFVQKKITEKGKQCDTGGGGAL